ncbi:MAG: TIGR01212 family radical SAM protein [Bacteriovoracaceae bacterium]|nr:TIGR01212 family radical SAM protein [Bacteriovoracaceae bacterium]
MSGTINSYSSYISKQYGERIQKISIDGGFTCPNRDGSKGVGGCTYCNNDSFVPPNAEGGLSVTEQIEKGIRIHKRRYKKVKKFFAYFQAYSNTYAPLSHLKDLYEQALSHPDVIGLCIGTRPDCIDSEKLDYLEELAKKYDITIEYGLESIYDSTLERINRGHDFSCFDTAIKMTEGRGIKMCVHIIVGFPWETKQQWIQTARLLSTYPIDFLKIHQLHIVKNTVMGSQYIKKKFNLLTLSQYQDVVVEFLAHLNPNIIVQRIIGSAPRDILLSEEYDIVESAFKENVENGLRQRGLSQGDLLQVDHLSNNSFI